jgi:hypothetical protein
MVTLISAILTRFLSRFDGPSTTGTRPPPNSRPYNVAANCAQPTHAHAACHLGRCQVRRRRRGARPGETTTRGAGRSMLCKMRTSACTGAPSSRNAVLLCKKRERGSVSPRTVTWHAYESSSGRDRAGGRTTICASSISGARASPSTCKLRPSSEAGGRTTGGSPSEVRTTVSARHPTRRATHSRHTAQHRQQQPGRTQQGGVCAHARPRNAQRRFLWRSNGCRHRRAHRR